MFLYRWSDKFEYLRAGVPPVLHHRTAGLQVSTNSSSPHCFIPHIVTCNLYLCFKGSSSWRRSLCSLWFVPWWPWLELLVSITTYLKPLTDLFFVSKQVNNCSVKLVSRFRGSSWKRPSRWVAFRLYKNTRTYYFKTIIKYI